MLSRLVLAPGFQTIGGIALPHRYVPAQAWSFCLHRYINVQALCRKAACLKEVQRVRMEVPARGEAIPARVSGARDIAG